MIWSHRAFFLSSVRNHLTENRLDVALKYSVKASARTQNSERILVMNFVIACVSGLAHDSWGTERVFSIAGVSRVGRITTYLLTI